MDRFNPNKDKRSTPQYALYQRENFWKPNEGQFPIFNTGTLYVTKAFGRDWLTLSSQNLASLRNLPKKSSPRADGMHSAIFHLEDSL